MARNARLPRIPRPSPRLAALAALVLLQAFALVAEARPASGGPLGGFLGALVEYAQYVVGIPMLVGGFVYAGMKAIFGGAREGIGTALIVALFGGIIFEAQNLVDFLRSIANG